MLRATLFKLRAFSRPVFTSAKLSESSVFNQQKRLFNYGAPKAEQSSFTKLFEKYNYHLNENPILTKSITAGIIAFIADIICQVYFPANKEEDMKKSPLERINWRRTANFTFINLFLVPPVMHWWYGLLSTKIVGTSFIAAVKRVIIDQSLFAPVIIPVFLGGTLILDGKPEEVVPKLSKDWIPTLLTNYSVWIPAQLINFSVIPPPFRVLWANFVGFFWNIYLSGVAGNQTKDDNHINDVKSESEETK
jgi:hypothetical protein